MCTAPKIPEITRYQESQSPTYRDKPTGLKGRRSTILTGGSGVEEAAVTAKKTLLGQ